MHDNVRVVICGGREFSDYPLLKTKCDKLLANCSNVTIVSGGARGTDTLAITYANSHEDYKLSVMKANWNKYGKSAGFKRNHEMRNGCDFVIAFWDGTSKGTKEMIESSRKRLGSSKVRVIRY